MIAGVAINYAVAEDSQLERGDSLEEQRREVTDQLSTDENLGEVHRDLPQVEHAQYVRLVLTATIRGVLSAAPPPGRPLDQVIADLAAAGVGGLMAKRGFQGGDDARVRCPRSRCRGDRHRITRTALSAGEDVVTDTVPGRRSGTDRVGSDLVSRPPRRRKCRIPTWIYIFGDGSG